MVLFFEILTTWKYIRLLQGKQEMKWKIFGIYEAKNGFAFSSYMKSLNLILYLVCRNLFQIVGIAFNSGSLKCIQGSLDAGEEAQRYQPAATK